MQDVLDEETRTNDALIEYTSAYYDMIQASYDLLAAMGSLEVDKIERAPANRAGPPVTINPVSKGGPKASVLMSPPAPEITIRTQDWTAEPAPQIALPAPVSKPWYE